MYCYNCGEALEDGRAPCPRCGSPVSGSPVSEAEVSGAAVDGAPVDEAAVDEAAVSEAPVDKAPVSGSPVDNIGVCSSGVCPSETLKREENSARTTAALVLGAAGLALAVISGCLCAAALGAGLSPVSASLVAFLCIYAFVTGLFGFVAGLVSLCLVHLGRSLRGERSLRLVNVLIILSAVLGCLFSLCALSLFAAFIVMPLF